MYVVQTFASRGGWCSVHRMFPLWQPEAAHIATVLNWISEGLGFDISVSLYIEQSMWHHSSSFDLLYNPLFFQHFFSLGSPSGQFRPAEWWRTIGTCQGPLIPPCFMGLKPSSAAVLNEEEEEEGRQYQWCSFTSHPLQTGVCQGSFTAGFAFSSAS